MPLRIRRSAAPLVLATSLLALAATGCSSETADGAGAGAGAQSSPSPSAESGSATPTTAPTAEPTESTGAGKVCATGDLSFTVTEESQAGGYYLVTATAKPGVTCTLEGRTIEAGFGSAVSGDVMPSEQAEGDPITMTGSTKAYAGVNPHSGSQDGGVQLEEIIVSAHEGDMDPVSLKLPSTAEVDQPVGTNWHTDPAKTVPFTS